jgi:uncharacterized membrane protein YcaP (DUF421 family)
MDNPFGIDPSALYRTVVVGVLAYLALLVFLRVSGKRTLSKMNAFDFVVTVALGSTLATVLLNADVSLAEGSVALLLLVSLQFVITWSSVRTRWVRRLATGRPTLLLENGRLHAAALRRVRVAEDELRAALRGAGVASLDDAAAVVLETDGSFSVLRGAGGRAIDTRGRRASPRRRRGPPAKRSRPLTKTGMLSCRI